MPGAGEHAQREGDDVKCRPVGHISPLPPGFEERVAMALAEAGYPMEISTLGSPWAYFDEDVPDPVAWRALELARVGTALTPICLACQIFCDRGQRAMGERSPRDLCLAAAPLTPDCGAYREDMADAC